MSRHRLTHRTGSGGRRPTRERELFPRHSAGSVDSRAASATKSAPRVRPPAAAVRARVRAQNTRARAARAASARRRAEAARRRSAARPSAAAARSELASSPIVDMASTPPMLCAASTTCRSVPAQPVVEARRRSRARPARRSTAGRTDGRSAGRKHAMSQTIPSGPRAGPQCADDRPTTTASSDPDDRHHPRAASPRMRGQAGIGLSRSTPQRGSS